MNWDEKFENTILYGEAPCYWLKDQEEFLKSNFKGKDCLVIADGQGRNGIYLASLGINVTAFDFSKVAVNQANQFAKEKKITNYHSEFGDMLKYQYGAEKFDLIVSIFTQTIKEHAYMHSQIPNALKKEGYFLQLGYTPKQLEYKTGGPPVAENMYTKDGLKEEIKGLEIIELKEFEIEMKEGKHDGLSALVCFIGKKK
eukprot:gene4196-7506_t